MWYERHVIFVVYIIGKQVFTGNADQFTAMTHKLDPSAARYIKFDVKSWHEGICMRVEVLGCDGRLRILFKRKTNYNALR